MSVALREGILDLYAPKFGLDGLGRPGEKIVLRIVLNATGKMVILFASYTIGGRHSQLAAKELEGLVQIVVEKVQRYTMKNMVDDINSSMEAEAKDNRVRMKLVWRGAGLSMIIGEQELPVSVDDMYTVGGKAWAAISCGKKRFKVELSDQGVSIFDSSRRRVVGLLFKNEKLVLQRAFQHPG